MEIDYEETEQLHYNKELVQVLKQHRMIAPGEESSLSEYLAL